MVYKDHDMKCIQYEKSHYEFSQQIYKSARMETSCENRLKPPALRTTTKNDQQNQQMDEVFRWTSANNKPIPEETARST